MVCDPLILPLFPHFFFYSHFSIIIILFQEKKAAQRHETIAGQLESIDIQVRTDNAELQGRIEDLERTNIDLKHLLSSRPTRRDHMDVLRRESALMREVMRLRASNAALLKRGNKKKVTAVKIVTEGKNTVEGKEGKDTGEDEKKEKEQERAEEGKKDNEREDLRTMDRTSMRVDQTLRSKNELELANAVSSLNHHGFRREAASSNRSVALSNEASRVGWASTCLVVALMKRYNLSSATDLMPLIDDMDRNASSLEGMQDSLHSIQDMVDSQKDVKVGLSNDVTADDDSDEDAMNLGNVSPAASTVDLNLDQLESSLEVMLNQRRILAFEQSHPEKVLHDILLHFQMIVKAKTLSDVVPKMQEMMARLQFDRSSLDTLRDVFGLPKVGQEVNLTEKENNELVSLVRAYAMKEGVVPSNTRVQTSSGVECFQSSVKN